VLDPAPLSGNGIGHLLRPDRQASPGHGRFSREIFRINREVPGSGESRGNIRFLYLWVIVQPGTVEMLSTEFILAIFWELMATALLFLPGCAIPRASGECNRIFTAHWHNSQNIIH
jgi:hypothetical protein